MRPIDAHSAEDYLRATARIGPHERVRVRELTGGVSNMVLAVERSEAADFVLKQARPQLLTRQTWHANVERIWREADVLRICQALLSKRRGPALGSTPGIVFEDRANYVLAIEAAPVPHEVWKSQLLAGRVEPQAAAACGTLLGTLHAESWGDAEIGAAIGDRTLFDQLRVDPYYRTLGEVQVESRRHVERVVEALTGNRVALVHADFSPKNLLVYSQGMLMVDFETGHFGDPAFDLGFFLSHLVLKACLKGPRHAEYLELAERFQLAYDEILSERISGAELAALWRRGVQNFALCGWARLDGKSPVEYLSDEARRERMRRLCRQALDDDVDNWAEVAARANRIFSEA